MSSPTAPSTVDPQIRSSSWKRGTAPISTTVFVLRHTHLHISIISKFHHLSADGGDFDVNIMHRANSPNRMSNVCSSGARKGRKICRNSRCIMTRLDCGCSHTARSDVCFRPQLLKRSSLTTLLGAGQSFHCGVFSFQSRVSSHPTQRDFNAFSLSQRCPIRGQCLNCHSWPTIMMCSSFLPPSESRVCRSQLFVQSVDTSMHAFMALYGGRLPCSLETPPRSSAVVHAVHASYANMLDHLYLLWSSHRRIISKSQSASRFSIGWPTLFSALCPLFP